MSGRLLAPFSRMLARPRALPVASGPAAPPAAAMDAPLETAGYTLPWRWRAGDTYLPVDDDWRRYLPPVDVADAVALARVKLSGSPWPGPEPREAILHAAGQVRQNPLFDAGFYARQAGLDPDGGWDLALHYTLAGDALGLPPSTGFDPAYYRGRNPDVLHAGVNALLHFTLYGEPEGRHGIPPRAVHRNPDRFDASRENVILVVHEASRTGAPILGWNIALELCETYNIFTIHLGPGALASAFQALSAETYGPFAPNQRDPADVAVGLRPLLEGRVFRYALVNSTEARAVLEELGRHLIPTVFLVHEFGTYVSPAQSLRDAFDWASEIVFSAPVVARSSAGVHPPLLQRDIRILPQGRCAVPGAPAASGAREAPAGTALQAALAALTQARAAGAFIVLGAGSVELRKGVDLFLSAASAARRHDPVRPIRFVWAGHGYDPAGDVGYSVYLREQLERSGLQAMVTFLGEVSDLEPVYDLADVFLLSSRLDPLPNVSIDAAHRGIPIICFQDASGTADLMLGTPETAFGVVPHLDAEAAGRAVAQLAREETRRAAMADAVRRIAQETFRMAPYVAALDRLGTTLAPAAAALRADAALLLQDGGLDPDFHLGGGQVLESPQQTVGLYLARRRWAAPDARRPAPGFDPPAWVHAHPGGQGDPFCAYLRAGRPAGPWQTAVLRPADKPLAASGLSVCLLAELPDEAALDRLLAHLRPNGTPVSLVLAAPSDQGAAALRQAVAGLGRNATVQVADMPASPPGHDLVGRVVIRGGDDGGRTEFELQRMLGGRHAMLDRICTAFAQSPALGLVTPASARLSEDDAPDGSYWASNAVVERAGHAATGRHLAAATIACGLTRAVVHVPGVYW